MLTIKKENMPLNQVILVMIRGYVEKIPCLLTKLIT